MTTLLVDTHVVHWWSTEPERLSQPAANALEEADELAVAAISWYELAWLAGHERITVTIPTRSWLAGLAQELTTVGIPPRSPMPPLRCPARSRVIPPIG